MHYPSTSEQQRRLHHFHGGLHLPDNKQLSNGQPVGQAALPERLILPLSQHIGTPAKPLVKTGERVLKGQMIAAAQGPVSAPVHASSSGTVIEIADHPVAHPSGLPARCIVIETDGQDQWTTLPEPWPEFEQKTADELLRRIRDAGIVGMGGAAFPTSVKLNPGPDRRIETLVINGAECEPYITCDDMLMREQAERVTAGIAILRHLLGVGECLIGIEDNKPEAIQAMTRAVAERKLPQTEVITIPTRYPSGGEKQLIRILTGKEVPSGGIPAHVGIVCHNVGTAAAVADAILLGKPLISRLVTLTGEGIGQPCNLEVAIGTPASELIRQAGGYSRQASHLILGGPMMGFALPQDSVPMTKASNCLLAASEREDPDPGPAMPCIRCGRCADACPVTLLPQQMYWYARAKDLEKVQEYKLFDCIECGCCSHVCPSHIPLVQYYRYAKNECWDQEKEHQKAEHARQRHEARIERLARIEAEKQARLKKKKAALKRKPAAGSADKDPKKAAIEAAMKRAAEKKAKLAEEGIEPANTRDLNTAQQNQIERADARRTEKTESEQTSETP